MSTATKQPTPEQIAAQERENAIQAKASYDFMTANPDYVANQFNNNLLAEFLRAKGWPWRFEYLEQAFELLKSEDEFDNSIPPAEAPKYAVAAAEPEFPWQFPLTKKYIGNLSSKQYQEFFRDSRFREQVQALGIQYKGAL